MPAVETLKIRAVSGLSHDPEANRTARDIYCGNDMPVCMFGYLEYFLSWVLVGNDCALNRSTCFHRRSNPPSVFNSLYFRITSTSRTVAVNMARVLCCEWGNQ